MPVFSGQVIRPGCAGVAVAGSGEGAGVKVGVAVALEAVADKVLAAMCVPVADGVCAPAETIPGAQALKNRLNIRQKRR